MTTIRYYLIGSDISIVY